MTHHRTRRADVKGIATERYGKGWTPAFITGINGSMQRYPTPEQTLLLVSGLNKRFGLFEPSAESWLADAIYKEWDNSNQSYFLRAAWPPMSDERMGALKTPPRMTEEFWTALTPKGRHVRVKGVDEFFAAMHDSWNRIRWRAEAQRLLASGEVTPEAKVKVHTHGHCALHDNWEGREMTLPDFLALPFPDCTRFVCSCIFEPPREHRRQRGL